MSRSILRLCPHHKDCPNDHSFGDSTAEGPVAFCARPLHGAERGVPEWSLTSDTPPAGRISGASLDAIRINVGQITLSPEAIKFNPGGVTSFNADTLGKTQSAIERYILTVRMADRVQNSVLPDFSPSTQPPSFGERISHLFDRGRATSDGERS